MPLNSTFFLLGTVSNERSPWTLLVFLFLFLAVLWIVVQVCLRGKKNAFPYTYDKRPLLTNAEMKFYRALLPLIPHGYQVWAKLGLWAVVKNLEPEGWPKIAQKHLDFVVVRESDLAVVGAIELDDKSHLRKNAQKRDEEKNIIMSRAKIPLVRIPTRRSYPAEDIAPQLSIFWES
ncbi:MAG: DUF2726 domain-containing protein [Planctomycetia bacterium]|nr:DUF2726 domain-containing protein [Planctomycetia bacterium]